MKPSLYSLNTVLETKALYLELPGIFNIVFQSSKLVRTVKFSVVWFQFLDLFWNLLQEVLGSVDWNVIYVNLIIMGVKMACHTISLLPSFFFPFLLCFFGLSPMPPKPQCMVIKFLRVHSHVFSFFPVLLWVLVLSLYPKILCGVGLTLFSRKKLKFEYLYILLNLNLTIFEIQSIRLLLKICKII